MIGRTLSRGVVTVGLALLLAFGAATAVAKRKVVRYFSDVTIVLTDTASEDMASGQVRSKRTGCKANRPVSLYFQEESGNDILIRTVRAKADGSWQAVIPGGIVNPIPPSPAGYFAVTTPKRLTKTDRRIFNCGGWVTVATQGGPPAN